MGSVGAQVIGTVVAGGGVAPIGAVVAIADAAGAAGPEAGVMVLVAGVGIDDEGALTDGGIEALVGSKEATRALVGAVTAADGLSLRSNDSNA